MNTLQGVAGQLANGALVALTPVYAQRVLVGGSLDPVAAYALLETAIGVGSLAGGFVVGLLGTRLPKGPLVVAGYAAWGLAMAGLALTDALPIALLLMAAMGAANMVYVIPSQTLFQERTPPQLLGRVVVPPPGGRVRGAERGRDLQRRRPGRGRTQRLHQARKEGHRVLARVEGEPGARATGRRDRLLAGRSGFAGADVPRGSRGLFEPTFGCQLPGSGPLFRRGHRPAHQVPLDGVASDLVNEGEFGRRLDALDDHLLPAGERRDRQQKLALFG